MEKIIREEIERMAFLYKNTNSIQLKREYDNYVNLIINKFDFLDDKRQELKIKWRLLKH